MHPGPDGPDGQSAPSHEPHPPSQGPHGASYPGARPAFLTLSLPPADLEELARLAWLEGVAPAALASEWVQRELHWLMALRRDPAPPSG